MADAELPDLMDGKPIFPHRIVRRATENEQPVHVVSPRNFTWRIGPVCFRQAEALCRIPNDKHRTKGAIFSLHRFASMTIN
ncbi:MAG: hypothetical protein ACYCO5_02490 [Acidobacteriaceae bacterium]